MEYLSEGRTFSLSYRELKEKWQEMRSMTDEEFMENLNDAIHLACIICFVKEIPTYNCLNDTGIVHELVHLLNGQDATTTPLSEIRQLFDVQLKLA